LSFAGATAHAVRRYMHEMLQFCSEGMMCAGTWRRRRRLHPWSSPSKTSCSALTCRVKTIAARVIVIRIFELSRGCCTTAPLAAAAAAAAAAAYTRGACAAPPVSSQSLCRVAFVSHAESVSDSTLNRNTVLKRNRDTPSQTPSRSVSLFLLFKAVVTINTSKGLATVLTN
jgi:hypothetical protein